MCYETLFSLCLIVTKLEALSCSPSSTPLSMALLLHSLSDFDLTFLNCKHGCYTLQNLYALGARRIGVTTLPPLGCLPAAITLFGSHNNECVERLNTDAINFNNKLNITSQNLQISLRNLTLAVLDIYQPLHNLVTKPAENGKQVNYKVMYLFPICSILLSTRYTFHRFFWSKEGLLWKWLNRDIYIVQQGLRRNMCKCQWICVLGWFSSIWGCKQGFGWWFAAFWHLSHIVIQHILGHYQLYLLWLLLVFCFQVVYVCYDY